MVFRQNSNMKTQKCLLVILCFNVLPNKSEIADICSAPLIELTQESCNNELGFDKFQIESSKKINWKKPLNGKIRFKFSGNSGKSDALRLKKCVKVLTSFKHEGEAKLIELTAYFQDNVPQNETTFVYTNENKIVVDLRKEDIHKWWLSAL